MNAERLLALYEKVAEAPDAVPRLRRFVLDLAVRGKLVPQEAGDEPASELLKRIAAEKARIVREGKFKTFEGDSDRNPSAFPFSIPVNWSWCYLDDLAAVARGGSPRPIKSFITDDPNGIPWIKIGDSTRGSIYIDATQERIKPEGLAKSRLVIPGDLLLSNSMSFGFPYITNVEGCIHDGWLVIRTPDDLLDKLYLHTVFLSDHAKAAFTAAASGAVVQNLNADKARQLAVPLPPLAEQRRIVAKVEELMALLDRLEASGTARQATRDRMTAASLARLTAPDPEASSGKVGTGFPSDDATIKKPADFPANARFVLATLPALTTRPDQIKPLRQTILNLAVRGKLVPQDTSDEPASELLGRAQTTMAGLVKSGEAAKMKAIATITEDDHLFEVPDGWCWARLGQLAQLITKGSSPKWQGIEYVDEARGVLFVTSENVGVYDLTKLDAPKYVEDRFNEIEPRSILQRGDLLLNLVGASIGRAAEYTLDVVANINQAVALIRPVALGEFFFNRYVLHYLNSPTGVAEMLGSRVIAAQPNISLTDTRNFLIPLPPLAEQHRIVAKVDALMALCDQLEASLTTTATTRSKLLNTLLHEALEPAADELEVAE